MYSWSKYVLENLSKKIFNFLFLFRKKKILCNYSKSVEDLIRKIDVVKVTASYCKNKKWNDLYSIWNIAGFILMTSLDIKLINEYLVTAKGFGGSELLIKSACVLMYEVLQDIDHILGKDFYQCLNNLSISDNLIVELNKRKKELSYLNSTHQKDLKKVRTIIGAHRDHDFLTQLEVFNNLEKTSILKLLNEFEQKLNTLSIPLQAIINESTNNFIKTSKNKYY